MDCRARSPVQETFLQQVLPAVITDDWTGAVAHHHTALGCSIGTGAPATVAGAGDRRHGIRPDDASYALPDAPPDAAGCLPDATDDTSYAPADATENASDALPDATDDATDAPADATDDAPDAPADATDDASDPPADATDGAPDTIDETS